jgi:hypothetical protein
MARNTNNRATFLRAAIYAHNDRWQQTGCCFAIYNSATHRRDMQAAIAKLRDYMIDQTNPYRHDMYWMGPLGKLAHERRIWALLLMREV